MHGVLVLGLFAGAVALAAYVNDWQDLKDYAENFSLKDAVSALEDVISSSQATAVSLPLTLGKLYTYSNPFAGIWLLSFDC